MKPDAVTNWGVNFSAQLPNGLYWQPNIDKGHEGYFSNDPDVPNERESLFLDWGTDFATLVTEICNKKG